MCRFLMLATVVMGTFVTQSGWAQEPGDTIHWFFGKGRVDSFAVGPATVKLRYNYAVHVRPGQFALITGWWKAEVNGQKINENKSHTPIYIDLHNGNTRMEHDWAVAPRLLARTVLQLGNGKVHVTFSIGGRKLVDGTINAPNLVVRPPVVHGGEGGGEPIPPPQVTNGLPSTAPGRVYRTQGSEFVFQQGGVVIERRQNGPSSRFEIAEVGPGFVDLFDRDRNMFVRLTNTVGLWRSADSGAWNPWPGSDGGWVGN